MARITVEIPDDLATRLSQRARAEGLPESEVVADALRWHIMEEAGFLPDAARLRRVAEGLRQLDAGEGISHATALQRLEALDRTPPTG